MQDDLISLMPALNRLTRALTRDAARAEDLAQEALARVWAQDPRRIADLRPYLMTAARNLARRPAPEPLPLDAAPEAATPPEAEGRLVLRDVAAALSRLPPGDARMLMALATGGRTYADLAADAGVPVGTVMSRLARARARLRTECGIEGGQAVEGLLPGQAA